MSGNDEDGDVWGKAGLSNDLLGSKASSKLDRDMEITFRPGLSVKGAAAADEENLTSLEKYQLRMKEKKARKKEKMELKRAAKGEVADEPKDSKKKDDFFGDSDSESEQGDKHADDMGLPSDEEEPEQPPAESEALGGVQHFSMKDILKAEKEGGKKKRTRNKKKNKKGEAYEREVELGEEGWKIDVKDDRFKALHEEPDFAIDPSNPQ